MRKKLKQKFMPKFIVREFFLKKINRNKIIFKLFTLKLQNLEERIFSHKLFKLLLDLILNFKNSWLYLFKLNFFNFFLTQK